MGKDFLIKTVSESQKLSNRLGLKKEDSILQTYETLTVQDHHGKFEYQYFDSNVSTDTSSTTTHQWKYSTEVMSDFYLELHYDNSTTINIGDFMAANAIEEVEVKIGSSLVKYEGQQLVQYLQFFSKSNDYKLDLRDISGKKASIVTTAGTVMIPLVFPGSNGFGDSHPINCSAYNSDLEINIKLRPGNKISKTNAIVFDKRPRLRYKMWSFSDKDLKQLDKNYFIDLSDFHPYPVSVGSATTTNSIRMDQGLSNKQYIGTSILFVSAANENTEFEYVKGNSANELSIDINNKEIYEHHTEQEAKFKNLMTFGTNNLLSGSYFYNIPYVTGFKENDYVNNLCEDGIKLWNNIPQLKFKVTDTTYNVYVLHLAQAMLYSDSGKARVLY